MWLVAGPSHASASTSPRSIKPKPTAISGASIPGKYSSLKGRGFSTFEYSEQRPGEAPSPRTMASSPRVASSVNDPRAHRPLFKCCAVPPAPNNAGAFQRFRYSHDPYERLEDFKRVEIRDTKLKTIGGSFHAGGNARDERRMLKLRNPELMTSLKRTLRSDWHAFLRVSADERGVLLATFAAERVAGERRADLHDYMNRLLSTHPASTEFGLQRDPSRWGVTLPADGPRGAGGPSAGGADDLVFGLRPPWVPNDLVNAQRTLELLEKKRITTTVSGGEEGAA